MKKAIIGVVLLLAVQPLGWGQAFQMGGAGRITPFGVSDGIVVVANALDDFYIKDSNTRIPKEDRGNVILVKVDLEGNIQWHKSFEGSAHLVYYNQLCTDRIMLSMAFTGEIFYDGVLIDSSDAVPPATDGLIAMLDKDGNLIWSKKIVCPSPYHTGCIAMDAAQGRSGEMLVAFVAWGNQFVYDGFDFGGSKGGLSYFLLLDQHTGQFKKHIYVSDSVGIPEIARHGDHFYVPVSYRARQKKDFFIKDERFDPNFNYLVELDLDLNVRRRLKTQGGSALKPVFTPDDTLFLPFTFWRDSVVIEGNTYYEKRYGNLSKLGIAKIQNWEVTDAKLITGYGEVIPFVYPLVPTQDNGVIFGAMLKWFTSPLHIDTHQVDIT